MEVFESRIKYYLNGSISENPVLRILWPKPSKEDQSRTGKVKALTAEQLAYVFECLENGSLKWKTFVYLLAEAGMRRGETSGLQWSDVDWLAGTITISRTLEYTPQAGIYENVPKNGKTRVVDIGPDVLELLRELRDEQSRSCVSKWVFTQDGSPDVMSPQTATKFFSRFGEKYGIENFHPHLLRHSCTSISILADADVASVSQRLGHADVATTLRTYTHSNEQAVRNAGNLFRNAVKSAKIKYRTEGRTSVRISYSGNV